MAIRSNRGDERRQARDYDKASLEALHWRIAAGDSTAREVLSSVILARVRRQLRSFVGTTDTELIDDAIEDALLRYFSRPASYDPRLSSLDRFLALAARRNVIDALRARRRRTARELSLDVDALNLPAKVDAPLTEFVPLESLITVAATPAERAFLIARFTGGQHALLASALNIIHLPLAD